MIFELVKRDLGQEDVVGDVVWSLEAAAVHVVGEDGLEARTMSVEEVLLSLGVVKLATFLLVAQQRVRVTLEDLSTKLVVLPAHVHTYSVIVVRHTVLYAGQ